MILLQQFTDDLMKLIKIIIIMLLQQELNIDLLNYVYPITSFTQQIQSDFYWFYCCLKKSTLLALYCLCWNENDI